jgi:hypothetical protein
MPDVKSLSPTRTAAGDPAGNGVADEKVFRADISSGISGISG